MKIQERDKRERSVAGVRRMNLKSESKNIQLIRPISLQEREREKDDEKRFRKREEEEEK